ncbi:MAG TPA: amidase [Isosphaeraceae bacterium]|jgi:aspartyl-tRNA(Asn)/glutamyl-tRNA(Gln) amidotransferase subunit A|nr:amidase [Isosphaeraceae bacterium]
MRLVPPPSETIEGISPEVCSRQRSCVQVLEACLARINEREPEVRAWVVIDRAGARAQAQKFDAELAAGRWRGPLHGIPIGIKDIVDVQGLPTACGSRLWANRVATDDAPVVARLRAAGAVIMGKTVTTQYAWIDPPVTHNPWNLTRTPGGSSSGSAAAVACGMCLGAIGSQTGGSITRPAAFCGVCGLKPTHGRLSLSGLLPLSPSLDHPGPIARTVNDLYLMWRALAADGAQGAYEVPSGQERDFSTPPPRLGRLRGIFHDLAEPAMQQAIDGALGVLAVAGAKVIEPVLPARFQNVLTCHRSVMAAEVAAGHDRRLAQHPDDYQPRITALIAEGQKIPSTQYIRSLQHQNQLKRDILLSLEKVDAFITPAALGPAPDTSTTGDAVFNAPWSYTGLPTISLPVGLSPEGLPLAIQLVGQPLGEESLFRIAFWCEHILHANNPTHSDDRRPDRPARTGG